jgi:hypothetical protein
MSDPVQILSHEGANRRERILRLAVKEAQTRKRRWWTLRLAAAGAAGAAVVMLAAIIWSGEAISPAPVPPTVAIVESRVDPAPAPSVMIVHIRTDPAIIERLAMQVSSPRWQSIGDEELLTALADAGRPAGLIHVQGRTILLPRSRIR